MPVLHGSCLCGGVKFEINGPLIGPSNAAVALAVVPRPHFELGHIRRSLRAVGSR